MFLLLFVSNFITIPSFWSYCCQEDPDRQDGGMKREDPDSKAELDFRVVCFMNLGTKDSILDGLNFCEGKVERKSEHFPGS